jgi:hypothetical protein
MYFFNWLKGIRMSVKPEIGSREVVEREHEKCAYPKRTDSSLFFLDESSFIACATYPAKAYIEPELSNAAITQVAVQISIMSVILIGPVKSPEHFCSFCF